MARVYSEEFHNLVGAIDDYISGGCRSSVTTTIHLTDTCQFTAIDDDVG